MWILSPQSYPVWGPDLVLSVTTPEAQNETRLIPESGAGLVSVLGTTHLVHPPLVYVNGGLKYLFFTLTFFKQFEV